MCIRDSICPDRHYLESWGDFKPYSNFYTLQQPTISPLFNSRQFQDSMLTWLGDNNNYYTYLKQYVKTNISSKWNKLLHDGYFNINNGDKALVNTYNHSAEINRLRQKAKTNQKLVLQLYVKQSLGTGYYSSNPWLQELPDTISKVTWDNYLTISPSHAKELGLKNWHVSNGALDGDIVNLTVGKKTLKCPVYIQPGQKHGVLGLAFGLSLIHI